MNYDEINKELKKYSKKTNKFIHEKPVASVLIALGAGFILGKVCSNLKEMLK